MRFIKYSVTIILIVAVWILLNSIDDPTYNDLGIHSKLKQVPESENGYQFVQYLNEGNYKLFEVEEDADRLRQHINGEEWDQAFVDSILKEKAFILKDIESATQQRPLFKFPAYGSEKTMPRFANFRSTSRLMLLESKNLVRAGNYFNAIKKIKMVLKFSQLIKSEENSTLISYIVGMVLQRSQIDFVHHFLQNERVDDAILSELQSALDEIKGYQDDGFGKVFLGEYAFIAVNFEEEKKKTLQQRLDDYWRYREFWDDDTWTRKAAKIFGFAESGGNQLLRALLPKYYLHPNEFLTNNAPDVIRMADLVSSYCKDIQLPKNTWQLSWRDSISPNSMTREISGTLFEAYEGYIEQRCLTHVYFDATRTIIALHRYALAQGELPENLENLVPDYLERLPIDYFDGSVLKYSKEDAWLYSVGVDYKDDGGSLDAFIGSENWRENPTIPIAIAADSPTQ